jgi:hypothetical protein
LAAADLFSEGSNSSPTETPSTSAMHDRRLAPTDWFPSRIFALAGRSPIFRQFALAHSAMLAENTNSGTYHDIKWVRRPGQHGETSDCRKNLTQL